MDPRWRRSRGQAGTRGTFYGDLRLGVSGSRLMSVHPASLAPPPATAALLRTLNITLQQSASTLLVGTSHRKCEQLSQSDTALLRHLARVASAAAGGCVCSLLNRG